MATGVIKKPTDNIVETWFPRKIGNEILLRERVPVTLSSLAKSWCTYLLFQNYNGHIGIIMFVARPNAVTTLVVAGSPNVNISVNENDLVFQSETSCNLTLLQVGTS